MSVLEMVLGADRDFRLQATKDGRTPSSALLDTDTLSARLWKGGNSPIIVSPACSWVDATQALFLVSFLAADTAGLEAGTYDLQVEASRSGRTALLFNGGLSLLSAPGSATALPVYCTYQDMLDHAAWIDQVQNLRRDQEGFARQRAMARQWFDNLIVRAFRGSSVGAFGFASDAAMSWGGGGPRRSLVPSKIMLDWLNSNLLMVRPQVIRINAFRAIAEVGLAQVGVNNVYANSGAFYRDLANSEANGFTAEIDTNGDGEADVPVPLGVTNTLFT